MELLETSCCAVREIDGLSDHLKAEEAMEEFCFLIIRDDDEYYAGDDGYYDTMGRWRRPARTPQPPFKTPGLIIFTGVVGDTNPKVKGNFTYGPNFKAYILKHKLGMVVESPLTTNRLNHPTHQIKAWMWRPNQKALNAWYALHGRKE